MRCGIFEFFSLCITDGGQNDEDAIRPQRTRLGHLISVEHKVFPQYRQAAGGAETDSRENRQEHFLDLFDVTFRIRRLQFLIRRINQREDQAGVTTLNGEAPATLPDSAKIRFGKEYFPQRQARRSGRR